MVKVEMSSFSYRDGVFYGVDDLVEWLDRYCEGYWTSYPSGDKLSRIFYLSEVDSKVAKLFKFTFGGGVSCPL